MTTFTESDPRNHFGIKLEQLAGAITVLRVAHESGNLAELAATTHMHGIEDQIATLQADFVALRSLARQA